MSSIEDIRNQHSKRLEKVISDHDARTNDDLRELRDKLLGHGLHVNPSHLNHQINEIENYVTAYRKSSINDQPLYGLVNLTNSNQLQNLDHAFYRLFKLSDYYSLDRLAYPTIFCETLEEFFSPFLAELNFSKKEREVQLQKYLHEAKKNAAESRGGIFGVNFPGRGCYLNGWLYGYLEGIPPRDFINYPNIFKKVLGTAAHEKLGHGFLSLYSAMGKLTTSLGLSLVKIASQFGMNEVDDASSHLKYKQNALLFRVSQFLEEGWSTWVQHYMVEKYLNTDDPRLDRGQFLVQAIRNLPEEIDNRQELEELLFMSLNILLDENTYPMDQILSAVRFMADTGQVLDNHFTNSLGQPLRYVLGELICKKIEENLGDVCVPYAALIAGNVTFDCEKIGFSDLSSLMMNDARLYPDVRLAAISKLKSIDKGNVIALSELVHSELSFSIPRELKP